SEVSPVYENPVPLCRQQPDDSRAVQQQRLRSGRLPVRGTAVGILVPLPATPTGRWALLLTGSAAMSAVGNWGQNCGGEFRNRVLRLSYTGSSEDACMKHCSVLGLPECLYRCRSGCQAVIFSQLQRLCHLLEFAAVPAALSSASSGDFFVRR
uniref:WSC domain-containing protein n=1 Tax=Macrostomum lignano TaxID=282301 RepID=A0A1I8FM02_9PLAT